MPLRVESRIYPLLLFPLPAVDSVASLSSPIVNTIYMPCPAILSRQLGVSERPISR